MRFVDAVALDQSSVRITKGGSYLVADARVARVGIQTYGAHELGLKDRAATDVIRVYRSPEEVFAKDALGSMAYQPMTNDHPADMVDSSNWKDLSIGIIGDGAAREVAQDGEYVRVSLAMMDQKAIDAWKDGKRELSVGYTCDVDFTPGKTADGQEYDAVQRNIRTNHLALVKYGRAGSACRIGDSWGDQADAPTPTKDKTMTLKTITFDGLPVADVSPAAEAVIVKLQGQVADAATVKTTLDSKVAELTTQNATKDAEIATLKTQLADAVLTPAKLQDAAKAYALVVGQAKALGATVTDGMDIPAIQAAVVSAKLGDAAKGWTADQIATSFATLAAGVKVQATDTDPLRQHLIDGGGAVSLSDAQAAHAKAKADRLSHLNTNYQASSAA